MTRAALVGPAMAALLARLLTGPHTIDDAYITFRYARNLAEGLGLVYNPGEWVLGTTAPLWAILLAGGYRLGITDLAWLATLLSAICDAASAVLLVALGLRLGWRPAGAALIGLAWAFNPMSIAFATGGMETSLFVLLVLAGLSLTARGRWPALAAGLAGVATLVRPEGALLIATVVGWTWITRRRDVWRAALAGGLPVALAGGALLWRYGNPLPNSIAAKQIAYRPAWPFENGAALLVQAGLPGWSTYLLSTLPTAVALILVAFGLFVLVDLGRRGVVWLSHTSVIWQPFATFAILYLAFYTMIGLRGVRLFPWYLVPIEPFYMLGVAAGLASLRGAARGPWLAMLLVVWQLPAIDSHAPFLPAGEDFGREVLLLAVGHQLAESLPPTAVVAAPEIGALGYASGLRILDTVGLVSPSALPYYPLPADQLVTDNAIPAQLIIDQQPDVVVTMDVFAQNSLLRNPTFLREYQLDHAYPAAVWQSDELDVYRRTESTGAQ